MRPNGTTKASLVLDGHTLDISELALHMELALGSLQLQMNRQQTAIGWSASWSAWLVKWTGFRQLDLAALIPLMYE